MTSTSRLLSALIACGIATSASAEDLALALQTPYVSVDPDSYTDVPLLITNTGATPSPVEHVVMPLHRDTYTFEQVAEGCGPMVSGGNLRFSIDPIPAGGSRVCTVRVHRPADEPDNMSMSWYVDEGSNWLAVEIGTFTDLAVSLARVDAQYASDGALRAIYRLEVGNLSNVGANDAYVKFGEECAGSPIAVDTNLPGGCVSDEIGCPYGGNAAPAARLSIAAGQRASCLVRFTAPPGVDTHVDGGLTGAMRNPTNGGWISDDNPANNGFSLDVAAGAPAQPSVPALSPWSMLLLAAALAGVAFGMRRRFRR